MVPRAAAASAHHAGRDPVAVTDDGVLVARLRVPRRHPLVPVGLLVEVAADDDGGGDGVEHAEDTDANHQLLQLVRLGAVRLHDGPDTEQRHEADQQETRA